MAKAAAKKARSKDKVDRRTGVQDAIEMGIAAVERGDKKQAYTIFRQTTELHPNMSEAWVWLGGTSPNLQEAESAFEKAYTIDPENEQASLGLRWVRLRRKTSLADIVGATVPVPAPTVPAQSADVPYAPHTQAASSPSAPATRLCPNCGKTNTATEKFCVQCGQDLSVAAAQQPLQGYDASQGKKGLSRRTVIFAVIAVVIAAALLLAFWYLNTHGMG